MGEESEEHAAKRRAAYANATSQADLEARLKATHKWNLPGLGPGKRQCQTCGAYEHWKQIGKQACQEG